MMYLGKGPVCLDISVVVRPSSDDGYQHSYQSLHSPSPGFPDDPPYFLLEGLRVVFRWLYYQLVIIFAQILSKKKEKNIAILQSLLIY